MSTNSVRTWQDALAARDDLNTFQANRLLLFALQMHETLEDIALVAQDALTDGSNDKKCDLVYVDSEAGRAIIAQGHISTDPTMREAPANKASDLNTACAWLLGKQYDTMPDNLRSAAEELALQLDEGSIGSIEFWYVHNLPESTNVARELERVQETAHGLLERNFPHADVDSIVAREIGTATLDAWYRGTQAPILVSEQYTLETTGGYTTYGDNWQAYSTLVPADWLRQLYLTHQTELFSANVRDYLGSRRSDKNINHNIKETAQHSPRKFWVLNNGITALVHDFTATSQDEIGLLQISGIAIVNGAQTTGALGTLDEVDLDGAFVPARFVKCNDYRTIQEIIRCNNSQNKVEASDFRSNDQIQTRLKSEFALLPNMEYSGGRRGGPDDSIRRPRNALPSYTVGQALAAFHGKPAVAYNQRSEIWRSDRLYAEIFNDRITAKHIVFVYSLLKAVEAQKAALRAVPAEGRTKIQAEQWATLGKRGATFLVTAAIGLAIETILNKPVADPFSLRFKQSIDYSGGIQKWIPVLEVALAFTASLSEALLSSNLSKNEEVVERAMGQFGSLIHAVRSANSEVFDDFAAATASL